MTCINTITCIKLGGSSKPFGSRIINLTYNFSYGDEPSSISIEVANQSGVYAKPKLGRLAKTTISIGNKIINVTPVEFSINKGANGRTMRIDYIDSSYEWMDRKIIALKYKHGYNDFDDVIFVGDYYKTIEKNETLYPIKITHGAEGSNPSYGYPNTISANDLIDGNDSPTDKELSDATFKYLSDKPREFLYTCRDLIKSLESKGFPFAIGGESSIKNSPMNSDYYCNYVGTVREVLSSIANDLSCIIYWGFDNKLHVISRSDIENINKKVIEFTIDEDEGCYTQYSESESFRSSFDPALFLEYNFENTGEGEISDADRFMRFKRFNLEEKEITGTGKKLKDLLALAYPVLLGRWGLMQESDIEAFYLLAYKTSKTAEAFMDAKNLSYTGVRDGFITQELKRHMDSSRSRFETTNVGESITNIEADKKVLKVDQDEFSPHFANGDFNGLALMFEMSVSKYARGMTYSHYEGRSFNPTVDIFIPSKAMVSTIPEQIGQDFAQLAGFLGFDISKSFGDLMKFLGFGSQDVGFQNNPEEPVKWEDLEKEDSDGNPYFRGGLYGYAIVTSGGIDALKKTADDVDFQSVLKQLKKKLLLVDGFKRGGEGRDEIIIFWEGGIDKFSSEILDIIKEACVKLFSTETNGIKNQDKALFSAVIKDFLLVIAAKTGGEVSLQNVGTFPEGYSSLKKHYIDKTSESLKYQVSFKEMTGKQFYEQLRGGHLSELVSYGVGRTYSKSFSINGVYLDFDPLEGFDSLDITISSEGVANTKLNLSTRKLNQIAESVLDQIIPSRDSFISKPSMSKNPNPFTNQRFKFNFK